MTILNPGDRLPDEGCHRVGNFKHGVLDDTESLICYPGELGNILPLASRKQDYIDAFEDNGMVVCEDEVLFAEQGHPYVCYLERKEEEDPDWPPEPGPFYCQYNSFVMYSFAHGSGGVRVSYGADYLAGNSSQPWIGAGDSVVVNIAGASTCPHGYDINGTKTLYLDFMSEPTHQYPNEFNFLGIFSYCCTFNHLYDGDLQSQLKFGFDLGSIHVIPVSPPATLIWTTEELWILGMSSPNPSPFTASMLPCTAEFIKGKAPYISPDENVIDWYIENPGD
jgi:hypothetical protein